MARHAQPREVAELKGAHKVHPERYRKEPPAVEHDLGNAPAHLAEDAKAVWFEIATYAPINVLKGADRMLLEVTANAFALYRRNPDEFPANRLGHLIGCLARLGMSPADRQKLGVEKPKEADDFSEF